MINDHIFEIRFTVLRSKPQKGIQKREKRAFRAKQRTNRAFLRNDQMTESIKFLPNSTVDAE